MADDLAEVQDTVSLTRRQVLVSGAIALLIAVVAGYAVAAHARRPRRAARARRAQGRGGRLLRSRGRRLRRRARPARGGVRDMQRQLARLDRRAQAVHRQASHELRTPDLLARRLPRAARDEDLDERTRAGFIAQVRARWSACAS
jgi:hypothetical protein